MYFRAAVLFGGVWSRDTGVSIIGMCCGKVSGKRKKTNNTRTVTVTWLWLLFTLCIVCSLVIQNVSKISDMNDIVRVMLFYSVLHLSSQNGFQL